VIVHLIGVKNGNAIGLTSAIARNAVSDRSKQTQIPNKQQTKKKKHKKKKQKTKKKYV